MELSDFMRNIGFNRNSRNLFIIANSNDNYLDWFGRLLSTLMKEMEELLSSYNQLNVTALDLKKMEENFKFGESVIDRNLWDRELKPHFERSTSIQLENQIVKVN
jgi:hypothetical protein